MKLDVKIPLMACMALTACEQMGPLGPVVHDQTPQGVIAASVTVPAGYETIYLSGGTAGIQPGQDAGNTESQAMIILEKMKASLAKMNLTMGDVVMVHCWLAVDPKLGKSDAAGWNNSFKKFFGTPEQPNKPARTSVTVTLGGPTALLEVEAIAVRAPKK